MRLKLRTWEIVEAARPGDRASRAFDSFIVTLIFVNVVAAVAGTVPELRAGHGHLLEWFELASIIVFSVEYVLRVWAATADPRYRRPVRGRIRFMITPMALVDLAAILPFYLPFVGVDLRVTRALRLMRLFRIAKLGRYVAALRLFGAVARGKREELLLTAWVIGLLLVVASSLMYYAEGAAQPDVFSSIPATMWWTVATLTTVGYGDVYPITPLGRVLGGMVAVLGIGLFALPTAILGSGFMEELEKERGGRVCPHCGGPLP